MALTRRRLIHFVGRAGGPLAAFHTLAAMGLLPASADASPPPLPPGNGRKVLILGAGIAGMVLALELEKAGYDPLILEARPRAGGRNWSLRDGDEVREFASVQRVAWDRAPYLYFNPGPARLPYHHQGILSYCRELNVPLEVMCNDDRAALMQDDAAFNGAPQLNRRIVEDTRGYVAELAAKAIGINEALSSDDASRLKDFVRAFGGLGTDLRYHGSSRAGWSTPPTTEPGTYNPPLPFAEILRADFWKGPLEFGDFADMAPTMMQPVGGMGRIGQAFYSRLQRRIRLNAAVTEIRRTASGARIVWKDARTGRSHEEIASTVVITIPLSVLRSIPADFPPAIQAAIAAPSYVPAGKVAFQAERRFWELDQQIYGGISWTSRDITQIWYPTAGLQQRKGILVGAYIWSQDIGDRFAALPPEQRLQNALADGAHLHPDYGRYLRNGVSIAWKNIPFSQGAWAEWARADRATHYQTLLRGEGPFLFAGEHLSYITGWQEGAVQSAHAALERIGGRA